MFGTAEEMVRALLPVEDDQLALLDDMRQAGVDHTNLPEAWAFIEAWIKQQDIVGTVDNKESE